MPLQNRVLPTGDIVADPARGTLTGNRGIIHRPDRTLGTSRWSHHAWICCTLDWQGRKRQVMTGRNWTELFFLDEAVALAAGHRPCGYCRRADYNRFADAWGDTRPTAPAMDKALHAARITPGTRQQLTHRADGTELPFGTMIALAGQPHLLSETAMHPFWPARYGPPVPRLSSGQVTVLTPAPIVTVLRRGYRPMIHATAGL